MDNSLANARADARAWAKMYGLPYAVVRTDSGNYAAYDMQHPLRGKMVERIDPPAKRRSDTTTHGDDLLY